MRYTSKENMAKVKEMPCVCCGQFGSDPHHIKSKGSGGGDYLYNLMPLCRKHHTEVHALGLKTMAKRYKRVYLFLVGYGWQINFNKWRHD